MKKIPITHSAMFDLYITDTVSHVASGVSVGRSGVLLRNSEIDRSLISAEVASQCAAAWGKGEDELESFVRRNFFPVGRAENDGFWQ